MIVHALIYIYKAMAVLFINYLKKLNKKNGCTMQPPLADGLIDFGMIKYITLPDSKGSWGGRIIKR